jgi:hypothetical protein
MGVVLVAAACVACVALAVPAAPSRPSRRAPLVDAVFVEGARGTRAAFACRGAGPEAVLELDSGIVPFGAKPVGGRTIATVSRREGLVSCSDEGARGALRLHPVMIRAVTPSLAGDPGATRIVLALDGQALGPRVAGDDDVYLVWRGAVVPAAAIASKLCPESRWSDERVVVCVDPTRVRGRGPARVRLQATGRLEEAAGAPLDLDHLISASAQP